MTPISLTKYLYEICLYIYIYIHIYTYIYIFPTKSTFIVALIMQLVQGGAPTN